MSDDKVEYVMTPRNDLKNSQVPIVSVNKADIMERLKTISDDEPLFLIRGQDITGPKIIRNWISLHFVRLGQHHPKIRSAEKTWYEMCAWSKRRHPD